jgi:predicted O-methyltransferase YrrM
MSSNSLPNHYQAIQAASRSLKFQQISEDEVGVLLRLLVSSKPKAKVLELGTGTGMGLAWIADGLDTEGELISVEKDPTLLDIARQFF